MNIIKEKRVLRKQIAERVAGLKIEYIDYSNRKIFENIVSLDAYKEAKTIFCFIGRDTEIDTMPIILDAMGKGKIIGVPKCTGKGIMEVREYKDEKSLELSGFGVLEPDDTCRLILPSEIDFAILPCVTCNTLGHRLGFGGGYYDRYLQNAGFATCIICRHEILCEDIPLEKHDIIPDMVLTENGIFKTQGS